MSRINSKSAENGLRELENDIRCNKTNINILFKSDDNRICELEDDIRCNKTNIDILL